MPMTLMATATRVVADGYYSYLQGSLAGAAALNETFWNATDPMIQRASTGSLNTTILTVAAGGSSVESETGSHVDVDAYSLSLGLSRKFETRIGETTLGLLAEFGNGSYDSFTSINWIGRLDGRGDVNHFGGGIFFHNNFLQGSYMEASLRGGSIDNDYKLRRNGSSQPGNRKWDSSNRYVGAHLGVGHKFGLTDATLLDVYGKVLWTRTSGETVRTSAGERYEVENIDSIRSRIGGRLTQSSCNGDLKGYVGLAWEHEFDGEARGYISAVGAPRDRILGAPKLKGSSGFGELGLIYAPTDGKYSIEAGAFGLTGKREGFGGTVRFKFDF